MREKKSNFLNFSQKKTNIRSLSDHEKTNKTTTASISKVRSKLRLITALQLRDSSATTVFSLYSGRFHASDWCSLVKYPLLAGTTTPHGHSDWPDDSPGVSSK
ncbi:hypothetical protein NPIL_398171 [Nephila pilipes]|uniref:Uncharacterized protein n=1 Tax=Nephila pilipes TaxID=299642 RepID=A0A8X6QBJ4_NEPPI|nr:hypothetical protein NPIL_398171 [Nephila pilipes]